MSRRTSIGIIGLLSLIGGLSLYFYGPRGDTYLAASGASVRVGAVLLALWLAFPQVSQVPPWIYGCTFAALVVIAVRPKWIIWVLPTLVAIWFLRPRPKKEEQANGAERSTAKRS